MNLAPIIITPAYTIAVIKAQSVKTFETNLKSLASCKAPANTWQNVLTRPNITENREAALSLEDFFSCNGGV